MRLALLLATTASLFLHSHAAKAFGSLDLERDRDRDRPSRILVAEAGEPKLAPLEHVRFCMRNPEECAASAGPATIRNDARTMSTLAAVNREVNASIRPERKSAERRFEVGWSILPGAGDCNDYAVSKRHELLERGFSSRALLLSVVKIPSGEGHLVLMVRTEDGDLVLDNLTGRIRRWTETGYSWLQRQSERDPRYWVAIRAARTDKGRVLAQLRSTTFD